MNKSSVKGLIKSAQTLITQHSPEILTGIGIAGMITTTVLAVRATPKALRLIEERKMDTEVEKLTPAETIQTTWKCYVPAAVTGAASIACLIGASSVHVRRNAALATAYKLSETALTEYRNKVVEVVGEKKEQLVRDKIAEEKLRDNPVNTREIIITGRGTTRCFDIISGRYFESDMETLKKAVNELNRRMRDEMYISVNEFYNEIGLDEVALGHDLGWNIDNGYIELSFSSQLDKEGTPCLVVGYDLAPKYNFR